MRLIAILRSLISRGKTANIALIIVSGLFVISAACNVFQRYQSAKAESEFQQMALEKAKLEFQRKMKADSILFYKKQLSSVQKLVVVQELTIKKLPDEKEVYNRFAEMPDSTAIRIFTERYSKSAMLAGD